MWTAPGVRTLLRHAGDRALMRRRFGPHVCRRHRVSSERCGSLVDTHPPRQTAKLGEVTGLDVPTLNCRILDPRSTPTKRLLRLRGERLERPFAHLYETGGMRRVHLRGHENTLKRALVQAGAFNLALLMRRLVGIGTPRSLQVAVWRCSRASGRSCGAQSVWKARSGCSRLTDGTDCARSSHALSVALGVNPAPCWPRLAEP